MNYSLVKKIDEKVFKGRLKKAYGIMYAARDRVMNRRHYENVFKKNGANEVFFSVETRDLLFCQYYNSKFNAYDTIVRLLAIEDYYGENDYGFKLYVKMQKARGSYYDHDENRFIELIKSFELNGYQATSAIEVDKNMTLYDGSHRLSLALYHSVSSVSVKMINIDNGDRDYGIDWFWKSNFSYDEIGLIDKRLFEVLNSNRPWFIMAVWPPMRNHLSMLEEDLAVLSQEMHFSYEHMSRIDLDECDSSGFVNCIYSSDDIVQQNIEIKKKYILSAEINTFNFYKIHFDNPLFRLKESTGLPLSTRVEGLKGLLRKRYSMVIDEYHFDNVCHVTDNSFQSKCVEAFLFCPKDVSSLIDMLGGYKYAIIKCREGKQHELFPKDYYYQSDIDFLVDDKDLETIADIAYKWADSFYNKTYEKRIITEQGQKRIRIEINGYLLIQFHFMTVIKGFKADFSRYCLSNILKDKYYCLPERIEILIRLGEYINDNSKYWHKNYIERYFNEFDKADLKYADEAYRKKIIEYLNKMIGD